MPVLQHQPHISPIGGDAEMSKQLIFPPDVEDFIDELLATAIIRAIENGTYVPVNEQLVAEVD